MKIKRNKNKIKLRTSLPKELRKQRTTPNHKSNATHPKATKGKRREKQGLPINIEKGYFHG